jgi:hypothetical protein
MLPISKTSFQTVIERKIMSTGGNPVARLLSGLTPGVQVVPFRGPDGRFAGGNVSDSSLVPSVGLNVGPGRKGVPTIGFDGNGMPKGGSFVSNGFRSNTFVQKQYTLNTYRSNAHYHMIQGQLVWLYHTTQELTQNQKKHLVYTAVTLPMLNELLRKAWDTFSTLLNSGDGEARRVQELRQKIPETVLVEYARTRLPSGTDLASVHSELVNDPEVSELYGYVMKSDAYALILAPHFVWARYKFAGSILSLTHGTSVGDAASYDRTGRTSVVNLVVCNKAEVHDIFTPVKHMQVRAKLFFHLTRRKLGDGTYGGFVVEPLVVANAPTPDTNTYAYFDAAGYGTSGLLYELGYVQEEPDVDDNEDVHRRASGVDAIGDAESMKRATASCRKIMIQMHKYI